VDATAQGAVIVDVGEGAAKQLGFQRGDLVLSINGERVASAGDLERLTKEASRLWRITISRGGQQISVMLGG
jgi:S1-C subfamily serine protease